MPLDRSHVPPSSGTHGGGSEDPSSFHRDNEQSPSSFRSGSAYDSDPSRWSFPASQYHHSAILEMGSAVPMEVMNPNTPREIQLDSSRDSLAGMSSILNSLSSEHEFVRNLRKDGAKRYSRVFSDTSFTELEHEFDRSRISAVPRTRNSHYIPASIDPYDNHGDESSLRDDSPPHSQQRHELVSQQQQPPPPQSSRPPRITAPLSPLTPLRYPAFPVGTRSESPSLTSASNIEDYITAHESASDENSPPIAENWQAQSVDAKGSFGDRSTLRTDSLNTPWKAELDAEAEEQDNAEAEAENNKTETRARANPQDNTTPSSASSRNILDEASRNTWHDGFSDIHLHNRSFSEPSQRPHPLPTTPYDPAYSSRKQRPLHFPRGSSIEHSMSTSLHSPDSSLSKGSASRRTVPKSEQRRRGSDTLAPQLALKVDQPVPRKELFEDFQASPSPVKPAALRRHSEQRGHSRVETSDNTREHSRDYSHEHSREHSREHKRHSAGSSRKRNFTKKSIENLLETNKTQLDIKDIGLPAPERRLLEKFVDTLSKLSIEVQMDEGKREEGLRRMHNALRALEGWI